MVAIDGHEPQRGRLGGLRQTGVAELSEDDEPAEGLDDAERAYR